MQFANYLPITYVLLSSILIILIRILQLKQDRSWAIACLGSLFGSLVLFPFINFNQLVNNLTDSSNYLLMLLFGSGIFWSLMVLFEFKALKYNEASQNILLNCLETSLLAFVSWAVFSEPIHTRQVFGALVVLISIVLLKSNTIRSNTNGLYLKLTSIACGIIAICLDKYLVPYLGLALVVFAGYLIPTLLYIVCKPNNWREQLTFNKDSALIITIVVILIYIAIGPIYVSAYSFGSLFSTATITLTRVCVVMLLAFYFLEERESINTKLICTGLNLIGIALILL